MKKTWFLILLMLIAPFPSYSKDAGPDEVVLNDGKKIRGVVLSWNGTKLFFSSDEKGVMSIDVADIKIIHRGPRPIDEASAENPSPVTKASPVGVTVTKNKTT